MELQQIWGTLSPVFNITGRRRRLTQLEEGSVHRPRHVRQGVLLTPSSPHGQWPCAGRVCGAPGVEGSAACRRARARCGRAEVPDGVRTAAVFLIGCAVLRPAGLLTGCAPSVVLCGVVSLGFQWQCDCTFQDFTFGAPMFHSLLLPPETPVVCA